MTSFRFSADEKKAISVTKPFIVKARVIKQIWDIFEDLREKIRLETREVCFLGPEGLDTSRGQIAKGERFEDLPFVFMDLPQMFLPGTALTYRTFFWWGHGIVFALILQGKHQQDYIQRIDQGYTHLSGQGLYLSIAKTPWEWRKGPPHSRELKKNNKRSILRAMHQRDFIKLQRYLSHRSPRFGSKLIIQEGMAAFRLFRPIISK